MVEMTIQKPEEALSALRRSPPEFAREMNLAAAAKWYELRLLSQERKAALAGLSRAEFLAALGRFGVSPFQYGAEEIIDAEQFLFADSSHPQQHPKAVFHLR
jgi:predicted HTH domain antitoxin